MQAELCYWRHVQRGNDSSPETIAKTQARFYRKAFLSLNTPKSPPYRQATVRDLYWLVHAEPFFTQDLVGYKPFKLAIDQERFAQLCLTLEQHPPNYFEKHHIARSQYRRLGLYFEALLRFLFTEGADFGVCPWRLQEHNVQIHQQGITTGEIDLLLQHRSGELVHVEVAVKYYLARQDSDDWRNWIGPNARDRLDLKMARLLDHQLRLLTLPESQSLVNRWRTHYQTTESSENSFSQTSLSQPPISSRFFIKGMLFRHLNPHTSPLSPYQRPVETNHLIPFGYWCKKNELLAHAEDISHWWPCKKMEWLSGPDVEAQPSLNTRELLANLQQKTFQGRIASKCEEARNEKKKIFVPQLCYGLKHGELCPVMIVDNHWPE